MSVLENLRARREQVLAAGTQACKLAADENRNMTAVETSAYESALAEIDKIDERITEVSGQERRAQLAANVMEPYISGRRYQGDAELADSFRSMLLERNPAPIDVRWDQPRFAYQPGVERRDLLTTAPANMSPVSFYGRLVEHMVENSAVLRAGATLVTTNSGEDLRVPRSTALSTAGIVAEGAAIPESDPTLSSVTLRAYKYGFLVQVSQEMIQDAGIDLEGYLAREAGQAIGLGLGAHLMTGTGTGQPWGLVTRASVGVTGPGGISGGFGAQGTAGQGTDLLYDLFGSLAEPYVIQPSAAWLLRNATLTTIRKLKTTAGEQEGGAKFVGDPPAGSGASASMIGKPAYVDPHVAAVAVNAKSVVFGDISRYFVRMANGIRFQRSDAYAFGSDLVTFRALLRADGDLIDTTGSVKVFQGGAAV